MNELTFLDLPLSMKVGSFHAVGHLILEEIPIYDDGGSTTNDVKDVTAVQIEMKAISKVKYQLFLFLCKPVLQTTRCS